MISSFFLVKGKFVLLLFLKKYENYLLLSRGVVFHIAPKNVDTIFVYSFVLSLLCANKNIIRRNQ